ncbi:NYN domain-containing protein [Nioella sp. MMSF_3534]|uniref:NYN domain-containing protein n=1 Tax=Nioella sp. MMSF_3534 TaxID=3046720 RepID=UPI00273F82CC|nr:NYN domain-containing protein [Nioella sp. MMSF_3534]
MSRVSVFVDGENISANFALKIFHAAQGLGEVDFLCVYGDAGLLTGWDDTPGFRLVHSGSGKNADDLLLTVDAMERALSGACDAVVIASSDGDFRHLAGRLRERGVTVMGIVQERAGLRFKASCSRFVSLSQKSAARRDEDALSAGLPAEPDPAHTDAPLAVRKWPAAITQLILEFGQSGGLTTSELGMLMGARHRVHIRDHPDRTWKDYLEKRHGLFELAQGARGLCVSVRSDQAAHVAAE